MQDDLIKAAKAIRLKAYAPYSNFWVGAAILADDGTIYTGCNVENAAYPQGVCAEAGAISAMIAGGGKKIVEIAISGALSNVDMHDGAVVDALCTPCGGCRQRIREFASDDCPIYICDHKEFRQTFTLGELLPYNFGPQNL